MTGKKKKLTLDRRVLAEIKAIQKANPLRDYNKWTQKMDDTLIQYAGTTTVKGLVLIMAKLFPEGVFTKNRIDHRLKHLRDRGWVFDSRSRGYITG